MYNIEIKSLEVVNIFKHKKIVNVEENNHINYHFSHLYTNYYNFFKKFNILLQK